MNLNNSIPKVTRFIFFALYTCLYSNAYARRWDYDEEDSFRRTSDTETFLGGFIIILVVYFITRALYESYPQKGPVVGCFIFGSALFLSLSHGSVLSGIVSVGLIIYSVLMFAESNSNNSKESNINRNNIE